MAKIHLNRISISYSLGQFSSFFKSVYESLHTSSFYQTNDDLKTYISQEEDERKLPSKRYYDLQGLPNIRGNIAQIIGPFQHVLDACKDVLDTFKPYKHFGQTLKDINTISYGLLNIGRGIVNLIFGSMSFLAAMLGLPILMLLSYPIFIGSSLISDGNLFKAWDNIKDTVGQSLTLISTSLGWLLEGALSTIRGITQCAAFPLSLLIKAPLRGIITLVKGRPGIQENGFIQRMIQVEYPKAVEKGDIERQRAIMMAIRAKYRQCEWSGQSAAKTEQLGIFTEKNISGIFDRRDYITDGFNEIKEIFTLPVAKP